jgi:hypothetical protein
MNQKLINAFEDMRMRFIALITEVVQSAGGDVSLGAAEEYRNLLDDGDDSVIQKIKPLRLFVRDGKCVFKYMYSGTMFEDDLDLLSMDELFKIANRL